MMLAAGEISAASWLTYVLGAALLFSFGYARAVWVRARKDYKSTRAAVKPLRKAMWSSIVKAVKLGVVVAIVGLVLTAWMVRDVRDGAKRPVPADVSSPSPAHSAKPKTTR